MKKVLSVLLLLLFITAFNQIYAQGQGFRYASVQYQVQSANATTFTVKFRFEEIWDANAPILVGKNIGDVISVSDINFGDVSTGGLQLVYENLLFGNWVKGSAEITHTYSIQNSPYVADIFSFNRSNTLTNNGGGAYRLRTTVAYPFNAYQSPAINIGAPVSIVSDPLVSTSGVINIANSVLADANASTLTYSLPDGQNTGMLGSQYPDFLSYSIDANTGVLSYTLAAAAPAGDYSTQVKISDDLGGEVVTDFIISVVNCTAPAPSFISPTPADGFEFVVNPGQTVNFTVTAQSNDVSTQTEFAAIGIPLGAIYSVGGAPSSPYSKTFSWTPTASDIGLRSIAFTAKNTSGCDRTTTRTIKIRVQLPVPSAELTILDLCSDDLDTNRWSITNPTGFAVPFAWQIVGSNPLVEGLGAALPGSTNLATESAAGNVLEISWYDDSPSVNITSEIWNAGACTISQPPLCETSIEARNCMNFGDSMTFYKGYSKGFTLIGMSSGVGSLDYSWSTGESTQEIFVMPTADTKYVLTITDSTGCVSKDSVMIYFEDITNCGNCMPQISSNNNGGNCGNGGYGSSDDDDDGYGHGYHKKKKKKKNGRHSSDDDDDGGVACSSSCTPYSCSSGCPNNKITICHVPPGNPGNAHTITISQNALNAHFGHSDDYVGACEYDYCDKVSYKSNCKVKLCKLSGWYCHNGPVTVSVKSSSVDYYLSTGNYTLGSCNNGNKTEIVYDMLFDMNVLPNPSTGNFNLSYQLFESTNVSISVVDLTGRIVYQDQQNDNEAGIHEQYIDLNNAAPGMYILSMSAYGETWTNKIQVVR